MGSDDKKKDEKKDEKKKPETVVLKMQFHCEQCVKRVKKAVASIKGVESIVVDEKQGKVTVVGHVEPKKVLKRVKRTGKHVEMLQPKEAEKKKDGGKREAEKKDDKKEGDKKKDEKKDDKKEGDKKKDEKKDDKKDAKKSDDYIVTRIAHNDFTYVFSDENPNSSCSIM